MYACLIQAKPNLDPKILRDIVDQTGNRYPNHDNAYGYGIPNFATALEKVLSYSVLEIVGVEVYDSQGNNDGKLTPGETVSLNITAKNLTSETLSNVTATISTDSPVITFVNTTADFGTFLSEETKTVPNVFSLTVSENAVPGTQIKFDVAFSFNSRTVYGFFVIKIYKDYLQLERYAVHFKDKENTPYSIDNPLAYLSQRAIDRRNKYGISIATTDLPVDPNYIERVNQTGAFVSHVSRWSNSALTFADADMLNLIKKLDCVEKTVYVKPAIGKCQVYDIHPKWKNEEFDIAPTAKDDYDYGFATAQIEQINGIPVHEQGYVGQGVIIAVLDGGFQNADKVTGLAHLFQSGRIVLERNVVEPLESIYDENISGHGTSVLSCMGGNLEGEYVGTAPQASYALIRTEDAPTEYLIEEYFWMIGAEAADSLGADLINSSLGYTLFDDPAMNHEYSEMDGKTAISSLAAKIAVESGIFVCNSAGNNNGSEFPWVGSPSDTPEALTLGAVNLEGEIASFSSIGPNGAGYPKPDVVACGLGAAVLRPDNTMGTAAGTSFSSPITCGMVACIIGAASHKMPNQILKALQQSANRYPDHNIQYGYGIPNFWKVLNALGISDYESKIGSNLVYFPNPVNDKLYMRNDEKMIKNIELLDLLGRLIKNENVNSYNATIEVSDVRTGFFLLKVIYENNEREIVKCIVIR
jgi:hypothetical protein